MSSAIAQPAGGAAQGARPALARARVLAGVCSALLLAALLEIVLDASAGRSPLVPGSPDIDAWLRHTGIGEPLGYRVFLIALLVSTGAYAGLLVLTRHGAAQRISPRWAIRLVLALNVIVFAGPILLSTDVFSYIAYARMGVLHGVNPYLHGPIAIKGDPVFKYVGEDWHHTATAYGPIYTLLSYPLAYLGMVGALLAMKLEALLASFGTLWLTWRCARTRGLDPVVALIAVGANPLYVIYGVGGAHNDLIMTFFMMAAVALTFAGRDAPAAASVVVGALVKATTAAMLPFMLLARRRTATIWGTLATLVVAAAISYSVFGIHGLDIVAALNRDAALVSKDSFATELAHLVGKPGVFPIDHDLLKAALVLIVLHLLWRTWRGYDWVAASGWALLAIAVTSTWLLAWYTLWSLPLAVVTRDRRLLLATLGVQALFIAHQ
ncbi:MAG TPA: polyprenol phosphomannose-dependent alpha 1,6 mannosyltransferase MptB, partial [Solirubrobacteraceae bacterium]|nr:polyprenol phosphomannose-dependent alpha 1,6 mannosyltransferase MptB [Solirubrobacteraceae bacterium]